MSSEKRLLLFTVVTFASILAIQFVMERTGLVAPPAPPRKPVAQAKVDPKADAPQDAEPKKDDATAPAADAAAVPGASADAKAEAAPPEAPAVPLAEPEELVIGSTRKEGPDGYRLKLELQQNGAAVRTLLSALYEAEYEDGKPRNRPLAILKDDPKVKDAPPSLAILLEQAAGRAAVEDGAPESALPTAALPLDSYPWEVVRDGQGHAVREVGKPGPAAAVAKAKPAEVRGQELSFRYKVANLGLTITKTFRVWKGEDGFEVDLAFASPEAARSVVYHLIGPHGIPIEGEWYTGTFRDAVFGLGGQAETRVETRSAYDIAKQGKADPERFQASPLRFAGVENQYFATVFEPTPPADGDADRVDAETRPLILYDDPESRQKSDIGVVMISRPVSVGPNQEATHRFRVFAGPKSVAALTPYGAEGLAVYRKGGWFSIPAATFFARAIITPLLDFTYGVTQRVAKLFGGTRGNYGIAIILLTMLVRMAMFPLGRKQAMAAKKMQDLQPYLKEIQEKFKDDKEAQTKETWALYKRHGANPVSGCLPALIQMPIFVGLWQALNNSVSLRHASFLYIKNLAAPDMLFKFPFPIPIVGSFLGDYFNVLPFLVVTLMLIQTKLFTPPPTTPEAEAQQKMMKYMMVFMAFMFYKVPSGLGIYFITSSLWQIGERLLLPKVTSAAPPAPGVDDGKAPPPGGSGGGGNGNGGAPKPPGRFSKFMEKVLDEAAKNPTYRKLTEEQDKPRDRDNNRDRDRREKDKSRPRPGRRR